MSEFDFSRSCTWCDGPMPKTARGDAKTCSKECAKELAANRGRRREEANALMAAKVMTPAMRQFRELMETDEDYVRELLQDVVRDEVTTVVKDNITGAAEVLTGMLPKALAGIAKDLESKDWTIRKAARDAVLKYAMMFKDKEGTEDDLGTIQVVHRVNLPDTPVGHRIAEELDTMEEEAAHERVEAFEEGWPSCSRCGERKHPDAMRYRIDTGHAYCSSCDVALRLKIGRASEVEGYDE